MSIEETRDSLLVKSLSQVKNFSQERLAQGLMVIAGVSQSELAAKYNVSHSAISKVLTGKRKSRKIREAIASELGVPVSVLWPA